MAQRAAGTVEGSQGPIFELVGEPENQRGFAMNESTTGVQVPCTSESRGTRDTDVPADAKISLTVSEANRLTELETTIEKGLQTFVEVGNALLEIRDSRLYRRTHSTFEQYVKERFKMTDRRARQLMDSAEVIENLNTGTTVPFPSSESVTGPLTELPPEEQKETWKEAVETAPNGKPPTAEHVKKVIKKKKKGLPASPSQESATVTRDVPEPGSWSRIVPEPSKPGEPLHDVAESVRQTILKKWTSFIMKFPEADRPEAKRVIYDYLAAERESQNLPK